MKGYGVRTYGHFKILVQVPYMMLWSSHHPQSHELLQSNCFNRRDVCDYMTEPSTLKGSHLMMGSFCDSCPSGSPLQVL